MANELGLLVTVLVASLTVVDSLGLTALTEPDRARLKKVFDSAVPYQDLGSAHYSVLGYKLLGESVPNPQEVCKYVQSQVDVAKNAENIFYASGLAKALGNCPLTNVAAAFKDTLNAAIVEGITSQNLYFVVTALKNLNLPYDSNKISKILTAARKKDDGALSLGYAMHVAALLTTDVSTFADWIEDIVVQADEVDGRLLQFEGGLSTSGIVVSGIYRLAEKTELKAAVIDGEKCLKFANYFMSRKQVQVVRPAYHLLDVLQILSSNKVHVPVAISLVSSPSVPVTNPTATVRISNLVGGDIKPLTVTLDNVVKIGEKGSIVINKQLQPVKDNKQLYEINLSAAKLKHGRYQLNLNAKPVQPDQRLVGISDAQVLLKLDTEVTIENVEIGIGDVDQSTAPRPTPVPYPSKLPTVLEVDYHQRIQMRFLLKDKLSKETMTVHQAFVVFTHKNTSREIIFVAEPDSANVYKFDLDVHVKSKEFGSLSGGYGISIIVGDAVISNPFLWHLGDVEITFHESAVPHSDTAKYEPKPEINHVFREPDKRPAPLVSNAFTVLALVPLLILFVLWYKIGVNVSNFNLSLGTVGFHAGLAGIFALFIVFWLKLTMFETLKYLILLGIVTFLCGNSMLSKLAATHKQS